MTPPSPLAYQEALQNPRNCFSDGELASGTAERNALSLPKPRSGNFGCVFRMACPGGREYAVKCFTRMPSGLALRYDAISKHLDTISAPWKVGFSYQPQGVLVDGSRWPILKMEWVDGIGLVPYIKSKISLGNASELLLALASEFAQLVQQLHGAGISHGDLQHGNILVSRDGRLRLVDYDGMFVPKLQGQPGVEVGHPNYQHPKRDLKLSGSSVDNFSAWVIYGSLVALAEQPSLWTILDGGDDCLIFKQRDYQEAERSSAFVILTSSSNQQVALVGRTLLQLVHGPATNVPDLDPGRFPHAADEGSHTQPGALGKQGLPSWMQGALPRSAVNAPMPTFVPGTAPLGTTPWTASRHAARRVPVHGFFSKTLGPARAVGALCLAGFVVILLATSASTEASGGRLSAVLLTVGTAFGAEFALFATSAAAIERRAAAKEARRLGSALRRCEQDLSGAIDERSDAERALRLAVEEQGKRMNALAGEEQHRIANITSDVRHRIDNLVTQRRRIEAEEVTEVQGRLDTLRRDHIHHWMSGMVIPENAITGIRPTLRNTLSSYGIRTAGDFTGVTQDGSFRLSNGAIRKVPGIGQKKAWALESWRQHMASVGASGAPQTFPGLDDVRRRYAARLAGIDAESRTATSELSQRERDARARCAAERVEAQVAFRTQTATLSSQVSAAETQVRVFQARIPALDKERLLGEATLASYSSVTFSRFLIEVLGLG